MKKFVLLDRSSVVELKTHILFFVKNGVFFRARIKPTKNHEKTLGARRWMIAVYSDSIKQVDYKKKKKSVAVKK